MGVFTCRRARPRGVRGWITPLFATCVALTQAIATPHAHAQDPTRLTIMVSGTAKMIYLPATLAQRLGYFRDEGLEVELLSQPAGVDAESELLTGFAQGVVGFYDHTIDLQAKGKEVRAIVVFSQVPGEAELVSTRLPATVGTMRDLRGHTLGVTGLGSSTSFLTRYLMAQQGLSAADYTMLPVGAEHSFAKALRSGRIDAGMTTDPIASRLVRNGEARVLLDLRTLESTRAALGGPYPAACLYLQSEWLEAHPELATKLAHAFVRTLRYMHAHDAEDIAAHMPPEFRRDHPELYVKALAAALPTFSADGRMPDDGPPTVLRVLAASNANARSKLLDPHIDLSRTYTNKFVDQVRERR
ncbi:ABC transporter substrate-binding protein [Ralstonia soli]|uniref:ABC transporter substrate-binding protein n=1 Tax=Ralstonia soli TaxID=2953896 RepID=A0ABT1AR10_9RALS|nr:ABC transporter substrate-binding protein [Ralstonia soli]MCO5400910.1 ABC transporter substrate-binding protein [Ralstonia soli]